MDLVDADLALQSLFDHHNPKDGKLMKHLIGLIVGRVLRPLILLRQAKVLGGTQQVHIGHKDIRHSGTTNLL